MFYFYFLLNNISQKGVRVYIQIYKPEYLFET